MPEQQLSADLIKESFDPKLIAALYKNFSDKYVALLELIDNAVDDKADGRNLIVEITLADGMLKIKNFDGRGMGREELVRFFTWGHSSKLGRIGRYGQGGKAALGYLGRGFIIKSSPAGSAQGYLLQVDNWQDRTKGFKEIRVEQFPAIQEKGSVEFTIIGLEKSFNKETIKRKIADTYRPLIIAEDVMFTVVDGDDEEEISCPPAIYDQGTKKLIDISFTFEGKVRRLRGEYGIVSDPKAPRGGVSIYQFGRLVSKSEYFGHRDPSKKWNVERLYGELYIDFEVPLLMNKMDADRDSEIWKKIEASMRKELEATIKIAIDYKKPTTKEEKPVAKIAAKVQREEGNEDFQIELANYGPAILFKEKVAGEATKLLINRDHKAYEKWSRTAAGKRLYAVMIYSLYAATKDLPNKHAAELHKLFSRSLSDHTDQLL